MAAAEESNKQSPLGAQMFRDTALRKMSSADDLDHYVRVTNPSAWVLISAVAVLIVAAFIWGMMANLPLTMTVTGVVKDGEIVCFLPLDESAVATTESKITAAGFDTHIVSINKNPHSQREVASAIGSDYAVESLRLSEWSYKVIVALPDEIADWVEGDDVPLTITMKEVAPLAYLLGGAQA